MMTVIFKVDQYGTVKMRGLDNKFARYEKEIISGKRPCPFQVEFRGRDGNVVTTNPIPLTTEGKPRIKLF